MLVVKAALFLACGLLALGFFLGYSAHVIGL